MSMERIGPMPGEMDPVEFRRSNDRGRDRDEPQDFSDEFLDDVLVRSSTEPTHRGGGENAEDDNTKSNYAKVGGREVDVDKAQEQAEKKNSEIQWQQTKAELDRQTKEYQQVEEETLSHEEFEAIAVRHVLESEIGKELQVHIEEQEKVQPPPKVGFFRRVGMRVFDKSGYERYVDKKEKHKIAQEKLKKAEASKEAWIAQEAKLATEAERVEKELQPYKEKISSGEMTKKDWKRVEKITAKLALLRDSTDRHLIGGVKEEYGFKSEIPTREDWGGFEKPEDYAEYTEDIKIEIIKALKGTLEDGASYHEGDGSKKLKFFQKAIGSNPDMKARLADLSPEWQKKFFDEQAGESLHQLAEQYAKREELLKRLGTSDSQEALIENPQTVFQMMEALRALDIDIERSESSVEMEMRRYSRAESLESLGNGIKLRLKQEFADRIADVSENFEVEVDTSITDILKNGMSKASKVARTARESGGALQIMGNRTKYGFKFVQEKAVSFVDRHFTLEGKYSRKITELKSDLAELNNKRDDVNEILADVISTEATNLERSWHREMERNLADEERQNEVEMAGQNQTQRIRDRQFEVEGAAIRQGQERREREEEERRIQEERQFEVEGAVNRQRQERERRQQEERLGQINESTNAAGKIMERVIGESERDAFIENSVREIISVISPSNKRRNELLDMYNKEGGLTASFVDELSLEAQLTKLKIERARTDIRDKILDLEEDIKLEREKVERSSEKASEEVALATEEELESIVGELRKIDNASSDQIDRIYDNMEEEIEKIRDVFEEKIFEQLKGELLI